MMFVWYELQMFLKNEGWELCPFLCRIVCDSDWWQLVIVQWSDCLLRCWCWLSEQVIGNERRYSRDSDSDEDIPDELRADFVDERTGDAPSPQKK